LPPQQVGLAIMLVLIVDAISDPVVGHVSDNLHSRWGRRHPFMYAAAVPVAVSFYFLWHPPDLPNGQMFFYLLFVAILVRTLITLYEIPSTSLVSELTYEYDERTTLLSYRYFFGWSGGISLTVVAYTFFFRETEAFPVGLMNPEGYQTYGLVAAVIIFTAILVSALGTHDRIPTLRSAPPKRRFSLSRTAGELKETVSNHSFLVLMGASLFGAMAAGLSLSSANYLYTLFWELGSEQIAILNLAYFGSAAIALVIAPQVAKRIGKKRAAALFWASAALLAPLPLFLRLIGWFPENNTPALLPTLVIYTTIDIALFISAATVLTSMVADIVEDSERTTGRRSEGVFFAARQFMTKSVSGLGIFMASNVLVWAGISEDATPGSVSDPTLARWVFIYGPLLLGLYLVAVSFVLWYRIDKAKHEENLQKLAGLSPVASFQGEEQPPGLSGTPGQPGVTLAALGALQTQPDPANPDLPKQAPPEPVLGADTGTAGDGGAVSAPPNPGGPGKTEDADP